MRMHNTQTTPKPFLKWAGGKSQLLKDIQHYYPFADSTINKYAEPFVGGGAVLFDILSQYSLNEVYISDINGALINTYSVIQQMPDELIKKLKRMQDEFLPLDDDLRKKYYQAQRTRFNDLKMNHNQEIIEQAALMIFLNKTCFNGLFRVNKKGLFNVPMGNYKQPTICDEDNIYAVAKALEKVSIVCADYHKSLDFIDKNTFVYLDPPYRPLSATASFTSYTQNLFNDESQKDLADFFARLDKKGAKIVVSNSDPKNIDESDNFFDDIYAPYQINRIEANRMINSNALLRGKIRELLISNF